MQRLAALSSRAPQGPDFTQLTQLQDTLSSERQSDNSSLSELAIDVSELDVLFALCYGAPLLQDLQTAERLFNQLSPYLLEAQNQVIAPSPFLRTIEPSPWEALSYKLTTAILAIGIRHPTLHEPVFKCIQDYLYTCLNSTRSFSTRSSGSPDPTSDTDAEELVVTARLSVSLLGFLNAVSSFANFFGTSEMRDLISLLHQILDENLMVSVEGVFSSIRTSENEAPGLEIWESYTKTYAASGRPLGAMILQSGFMKLLVSCSSLLVSTVKLLQKSDTLDILTSEDDGIVKECTESGIALVELVSEISTESMRLLEDGSDYLQLGSAWQQQLAFAVKGQTLHAFLNCMVVDEEIADVDIFMTWLEDTMADSVQMADEALSSVVLKSMAVVAKYSPSIASTLSRLLPRFLVQSPIQGNIVIVAARSLTYILQLLSQDAVITGLYSLGNVLSTQSGTDRATNGSEPLVNGSANLSKVNSQYTQHTLGSAISLYLSGEEETAVVYGNIVRAVVCIACGCQDEKITALAQSMLLQKLGKVNLAVDLHIVTEAAKLATAGGITEFKSLLKLYVRLGHEAVVRGDETLARSVRFYKCQSGDGADTIYRYEVLEYVLQGQ